MKPLAHNYLLLCSYYYLILSITILSIILLTITNGDPIAHGYTIMVILGLASPILILIYIFGPMAIWYILPGPVSEYIMTSIIVPILIIILSLKAIKLLKKRDYSKSFFKFWCFISILNLVVFIIEFGLFFSNKFEIPLYSIFPSLINSIVIFLSAHYLYRQQKNSLSSPN